MSLVVTERHRRLDLGEAEVEAWMVRMFGWLSAKAARASRRNSFDRGKVGRYHRRQKLQRDLASKRQILSEIDHAIPPTPSSDSIR
jgi:hypothetical protein